MVTETRKERFDARITPAQKALFQQAAQMEGRSVTDFVISSAEERAERVMREAQTIALSPEDSRRFVAALLEPSEPNDYLRAAMVDYYAFTGAQAAPGPHIAPHLGLVQSLQAGRVVLSAQSIISGRPPAIARLPACRGPRVYATFMRDWY